VLLETRVVKSRSYLSMPIRCRCLLEGLHNTSYSEDSTIPCDYSAVVNDVWSMSMTMAWDTICRVSAGPGNLSIGALQQFEDKALTLPLNSYDG